MNERIVRKNRMSGFVVCGRASSSASSVCGQVSSFVVSGFDVGQAPIPSSPSERVKNRHYRQRALPYMRKSPFIHDDELSRCPRQSVLRRRLPSRSASSFVVLRVGLRRSSVGGRASRPRGLSGLRSSLTSVLSATIERCGRFNELFRPRDQCLRCPPLSKAPLSIAVPKSSSFPSPLRRVVSCHFL